MKVFFREAIVRALQEEMERDESVFIMGQDVGRYGGPYRETAGLFGRFGEERVRDTPVAEAACMGIALGAALAGLRPVNFITSMDFLALALDPLVNHAAKVSFLTGGRARVPLVVKTTGGADGMGVTHCQSFHAWLLNVPGIKVVAPAGLGDAYALLKTAIRDDSPVVFVDHKRLYATSGELAADERLLPFGRAAIIGHGRDLAIVSYSYGTQRALRARQRLAEQGVEASVVDLRTLCPLDVEGVAGEVARSGVAVLLDEGPLMCGVTAELASVLHARLPSVRLIRIGSGPIPISFNPPLESACLPQESDVVAAALNLLSHNR